MANVTWDISNLEGTPAGQSSVDEDQMLKVPHTTDASGTKRAGDLIAGDYFCSGSKTVYCIAAVV